MRCNECGNPLGCCCGGLGYMIQAYIRENNKVDETRIPCTECFRNLKKELSFTKYVVDESQKFLDYCYQRDDSWTFPDYLGDALQYYWINYPKSEEINPYPLGSNTP